jgi:tetratricopeptide (TPR) repeat protein
VVASRQRRHKQAQQLFEKALAIAERNFGSSHPQVASILTNVALELMHQKRYEEALLTYTRAEQIQERVAGDHTAAVARLWRDIALTYDRLNDIESSLAAYRKAVKGLQDASGPEAPDLAIWLGEYAALLKRHREFGEAERAQTESLRIQVRNTLKANQGSEPAGS